jgi:hypothetical protein
MSRRYKFDPDRIRPRKAEDRLARKRVGGVLSVLRREIKQSKRRYPMTCEGCGQNPADPPGALCVGCEAYKEHQQ